jgi:hypothetical protein
MVNKPDDFDLIRARILIDTKLGESSIVQNTLAIGETVTLIIPALEHGQPQKVALSASFTMVWVVLDP